MIYADVFGISINLIHAFGIVFAGAFFWIATMGLRENRS